MPLDPDREAAILAATFELLADVGYDRMSIDQIARRASASKATIYRRWSGKAELVADVVRQRMRAEHRPLPDTGSLGGDLVALCQAHCGMVERKRAQFLGLLPVFLSDPELASTLRAARPTPELDEIASLLDRARARDELAGAVQPAELLAILEAVVWHRILFTGEPTDAAFVETLADRVLLPLVRSWSRA
ncbi:MAG: TetR/AcrR family transcriptional regulator [Actinopolymorphaceae bacterium]